jgi:hypothetical protein
VSRSCQNLNFNWIQISLQLIKRFGKKGTSKSYSVMGRNPAHTGASPAHPSPLFLFRAWLSSRPNGLAGLPPRSHTAHEAAQPAQRLPRHGPASLPGTPRLSKHTQSNKGRSDPLSTRYRLGTEFVPTDSPPLRFLRDLHDLGRIRDKED